MIGLIRILAFTRPPADLARVISLGFRVCRRYNCDPAFDALADAGMCFLLEDYKGAAIRVIRAMNMLEAVR